MVKCTSCGAEIRDGSSFCSKCGAAQPTGMAGNQSSTAITGDHFKTMGRMGVLSHGLELVIENDHGTIGSVAFSGGLVGEFVANFQLIDPQGNMLLRTQHNKPKKLISTFKNYTILDSNGTEIGQMDIHTRKATIRGQNGQEYEATENIGGRDIKISSNGTLVGEIKHHLESKYFEGKILGDIPAEIFVTYLLYRTMEHAVTSSDFMGGQGMNGLGFRM
ncbi:zinc ribbon domain-containing protein [Cuniculiplasma divulgatum]|jgi:hypothetical protein|nr:zinc ribbon domain-containing protein [Cuniculiplasma divulgatum]MCI2411918.1 zinc ribbon domain-containing protein [Cuniculiplasma sp.]WMT49108.1 MAG: zinc ribbon domain-containing protein [Thermoplasmatales archaeon]